MTTPDVEHLEVLAEEPPPPSQVNDALVVVPALLAAILGVVFAVVLRTGGSVAAYGLPLALAMMLLAYAVRRHFAGNYPDIEAAEPRLAMDAPGPADERIADVAAVGRCPFLTRILVGAGAVLGLSFAAPVASLGPSPGGALRRTLWSAGKRLVDGEGLPIRPGDVARGGLSSVWPEGGVGAERSAVLLVRLSASPQPPTNLGWVVGDDLVAYSKVCTHAGCPVALYRERDNALFCPCHQSTFDALRGAAVTFGPAARGLPQLPLGVNDEGQLIALGDFTEQVGPAYG